MTDELPGLGRYVDALSEPVAIDEVTGRPHRSRARRTVALAVAAVVVVAASAATVVVVSGRDDRKPAQTSTPAASTTTASTTTSTTAFETVGDAMITSAPLAPAWINDISASDTGLRVTGFDSNACHAATVDPQTLAIVDPFAASCDDPASMGESVTTVDHPVPNETECCTETLSIARVDPTTHKVTTGPVVMTYGSYSDTRPITAYGGDWLWIYAVETKPNGPEVLQVSRSTGEVVNTVAMPQLYRPLLAANDDGLWVGQSVQGGQCEGCGPPPTLTFVGAGARSAVTVHLTENQTTYWLHASGHRAWASVGSFTSRAVVRFDGTDLQPVFRVPEPKFDVVNVVGDDTVGLWSVVSESETRPRGGTYRYDVVRIDPATGREERFVRLDAFTMPAGTFVVDDPVPAFFDGSLFVLEPPYRNAFSGFGTILRVTPR